MHKCDWSCYGNTWCWLTSESNRQPAALSRLQGTFKGLAALAIKPTNTQILSNCPTSSEKACTGSTWQQQHELKTSPKNINRKLSTSWHYSQWKAAKDLRLGCFLVSSVLLRRFCFFAAAAAIHESATIHQLCTELNSSNQHSSKVCDT